MLRSFFDVFEALEHSRNDPDQFWEKWFSQIVVDVRQNFRGVARFRPKLLNFSRTHHESFKFMIIHPNSSSSIQFHDNSSNFMIIHSNSCSFIQIHDHSSKFTIIHANSWSFIEIHDHSSNFMIIHRDSWSFSRCMIIHRDSWSFIEIHDHSSRLLCENVDSYTKTLIFTWKHRFLCKT